MADYYNPLPPVEKSASSSIDVGLFTQSFSAAIDAAAKQTNVLLGQSNQADNVLQAQQARAKAEQAARAEQQKADFDSAVFIRMQTSYQEETSQYLQRVQNDSINGGRLVDPEQLKVDLTAMGNKYIGSLSSQTNKARFEALVSGNAINTSQTAFQMNDKVVKAQSLAAVEQIQDDAAKKLLQNPSNEDNILLESQQRLAQIPLSKELKYATDLELQQTIGDSKLQQLAQQDPDQFLQTFASYDKPFTKKGAEDALKTAQKVFKERIDDFKDFVSLTTIGADNGSKELRKSASKAFNKQFGSSIADIASQAPEKLGEVFDMWTNKTGAKVLPQEAYDTMNAGANFTNVAQTQAGANIYNVLKSTPQGRGFLNEISPEVAYKYDTFNNQAAGSPEEALIAAQTVVDSDKNFKVAPESIQELVSVDFTKSVGDSVFNRVLAWDDDARLEVMQKDVGDLVKEAYSKGNVTESKITSYVEKRLPEIYKEIVIGGELQIVRSRESYLQGLNVDDKVMPILLNEIANNKTLNITDKSKSALLNPKKDQTLLPPIFLGPAAAIDALKKIKEGQLPIIAGAKAFGSMVKGYYGNLYNTAFGASPEMVDSISFKFVNTPGSIGKRNYLGVVNVFVGGRPLTQGQEQSAVSIKIWDTSKEEQMMKVVEHADEVGANVKKLEATTKTIEKLTQPPELALTIDQFNAKKKAEKEQKAIDALQAKADKLGK